MDIAITGASGLIGSALAEALRADGHHPIPVVRRKAGSDEIEWQPAEGKIDAGGLEGLDGVVHLAGAGVADKRWSSDRKRLILESRTKGTALLADTLVGLAQPPRVLVSGSAIGYYGDRGDDVVDEQDPPGSDFLADVVVAWEASARTAVESDIRVCFARSGVVLDADGGALAKQLPLFKFGLGGKLGSGDQYLPWITIDDEVSAIIWLLTADVSGPVNLTAPNPVTNAEFTDTLGEVLHRPTFLPIPKFGPQLLLGRELAESLLYTSSRVIPSVLTTHGFDFSHPELAEGLRAVLGK